MNSSHVPGANPLKQFPIWFRVAQLAICVWCGAATFFVGAVIRLRQSPLFPEDIKLHHPKVLFPWYYEFELTCLIMFVSGLALTALWVHRRQAPFSLLAIAGLAVAVVGIAVYDYVMVFLPLAKMLDQSPLPDNFRPLHTMSMWLNGVLLVLSYITAGFTLFSRGTHRAPAA